MDLKDVTWERDGGVVTLTMNRPEKLNAQSMDMMDSLIAAFEEIERDDDIKCAIWTGAGRGWSSGRDFSDPKLAGVAPYGPEFPRGTRLLPLSLGGRLQFALWRCRKPIIAAVNGHMLGGAFSAGLMADFRIASERAKFGALFVKRGRVPDNGGVYMLVKIMGLGPALEFMYSGEIIDARQAVELGLANRVVPHDELMPTCRKIAANIAAGPSLAIEFMKKIAYRTFEGDSMESLTAYEAFAQSVCEASEDGEEGVRSFAERREPVFTGR